MRAFRVRSGALNWSGDADNMRAAVLAAVATVAPEQLDSFVYVCDIGVGDESEFGRSFDGPLTPKTWQRFIKTVAILSRAGTWGDQV